MKYRVVISWIAMLALTLALLGCSGSSAPSETSATTQNETSTASSPDPSSSSTEATLGSTTTIIFPTTLPSPTRDILRRMTLREKAAQVLLLAFQGTTMLPSMEELLSESPPGGFLLLAHNVADAEQLRSLTASLQEAAKAGGAGVGLFIAVDQEGGPVQRIHDGVPLVPAARTLGQQSALTEAGRLAAETAVGLLALGVNMNLAPVADVVSDQKSFLYRRTYGGDPTHVADFVEVVTRSYVENGLIAVVKHFPGHGSASGNTHGQIVISDTGQADFATIHLPPFKAAIRENAEGVMVAHVFASAYDPDLPASLSPRVVTGLLRGALDFRGMIVTDDLEMVAAAASASTGDAGPKVPSDPGELAVLALEAGCDLLITSGPLERQRAMMEAIVEAVQTGRLAGERLDEAVLRVLDIKLRHALISP